MPIVAVVKPDCQVSICGDYQLTVNRASRLEAYPLPRIDELFASMSGGCLIYEAISQACVPTTGPGRRVEEVHNNQHAPRVIQVQQATIRHLLCSGHFPEDYGQPAPGCATCSQMTF